MTQLRRALTRLAAIATMALLAACGGSNSTSDSSGTPDLLPFSGTRSYQTQVTGQTGSAMVLVQITNLSGGRASTPTDVLAELTSSDGAFSQSRVTVTSLTANRIAGTVTTTAGDLCDVVIEMLEAGARVRLTLTCDGQTATGEGAFIGAAPAGNAQAGILDALKALVIAVQGTQGMVELITEHLDELRANGTVSEAGCPAVNGTLTPDALNIQADFGAGCSPSDDGTLFAGSVSATTTPEAAATTFTFTDFSVDGRVVNGTATLGRPTGPASAYTLDLDLTTGSGAAVAGQVAVTPGDEQVTLDSDGLAVTVDDQTYQVAINGLVVTFDGNRPQVPSAGSITVVAPGAGPFGTNLTLTSTFNESTPVNGQFTLRVNNLPAQTFTLPGY